MTEHQTHTAENDAAAQMPLADLLRDYRDGDERGWQTEFDWLDSRHAGRMDMLTTSVQEVGIREPILLGNDGRVWDGHHRIAVAYRLALVTVPVRVIPPAACRCGCPAEMHIGDIGCPCGMPDEPPCAAEVLDLDYPTRDTL